jgi:Spy/CpxP family protein refolding chaperone
MKKHRMSTLAAAAMALAIGVFASTADAQDRPQGDAQRRGRQERFDPAQRLERRVAFLTEQLQLSASQQTQVRSILSEEMNALQALRPQGEREQRRPQLDSARRDSVRAQMQQLRQRTNERIAGVLNAQQRTKYQELQKQMGEHRGRGRGGADRSRSGRHSRALG